MERTGLFSGFDLELEDFEVRRTKTLISRLYSMGTGGSIHCTPKTKDSVVFFCSVDHYVYALACESGKVVWRFKTDGPMGGNSPELHGNTVYTGNMSGSVYAIDAKTGRMRWMRRLGGGGTTKALFYGGRLYLGSLDGSLYCLESDTGEEIWRFRTGGEIFYAPSGWEGKIYFGSGDGNFYCVNAESGKETWRFRTGDEVWSEMPSEIHKGVVYFASLDNNLYAVNAGTGKEIWRFRTGKYGNSFSPVVHDDVIYHGSRDGFLYALTLEGKEMWRFRADGLIAASALAHEGRLYFGSEDTNLYCLDLKTGKEIWRFRTGGQVWSPPAAWNDLLLFGSWDCRFYCISLEGKERWRFTTSDTTVSKVDPPYNIFEMVVKKAFSEAEETEGKYDLDFSGRIDGDVYNVKSEYVTEVTYATRKDYGE